MKLKKILEKNNFPSHATEIITSSGIENLYPPQNEAIQKGILSGNNLLMSVPTAAGKTLIAELCMLKGILFHNKRCLYIAPLKALASEKYNDFKSKYSSLGINVGLAIGDIDSPSKYLNRYQILVATAEKVDSLIRSKASWLIGSLGVVILDEIHFINDGARGPTLEILAARIRQLNENVQILALSATVSNAQEMANWLNAQLVLSDWRPIPLKEGVYYNERITFDGAGVRVITEDAPDDLGKICLDTLRKKGQVLIFVNSRRSTQAVCRQIAASVSKVLTPEERKALQALSKRIAGNTTDSTKICRKLSDVINFGVAFHHAGLKPNQRELIESNFKNNLIKVISCTPTLAAGVNLPARRAVIRDCKRFESGMGSAYIPTSEYKQCAGRAGRPQYDDFGEAVMIAKSLNESETLFERYIHAKPEPIISKLADEAALRIHILASIAGGYIHDVKGMLDFISHTFLYHQNKHCNLLNIIGNIFEFLHEENFIEKSGYRFFPTPLGNLTSRLYIDPISTITIRDGLKMLDNDKAFSSVGILHLITCCPDCPQARSISKKIYEELQLFGEHFHNELILTPENWPDIDDFHTFMGTLKTTWMLQHWIEEEKEDMICDQFNVGPGDIYRYVESTRWLLYASMRIAELLRKKSLSFELEKLRSRVDYGIKEELLELVKIKGIGRIRARNLFKKGYKTLSKLKSASQDNLSKIPTIGKGVAEDILSQIKKMK